MSTITEAIGAAEAASSRAFDDAVTSFGACSIPDRQRIVEAISSFSLQHQARMTRFAQAVETAPAAERENAAKELNYHSTTELLQHEMGHGKQLADGLVRLGKLVEGREYPVLAAAVEQGTVSNHQGIVIVRQLDSWRPTCDSDFMQLADKSAVEMAEGSASEFPFKAEQLQTLMRAWFRRQNPEEAQLAADEQHDQRKCQAWVKRDGSIGLSATLSAADGAAILHFLDANAAPRARFSAPGGDPDLDGRTRPQKMADALVLAFTVAAKSRKTSTQGGGAPTVTVTVPINEMRKHAKRTPALATVGRTQEVVPVEEISRLICEGAVQVAATGHRSEVLSLGRSQRLFSPAQRKALNQMYPDCATSGCSIPAVWCESHHVSWWSRGGPTDIANGINLCNYHHHEVHNKNLEVIRDPESERWKAVRVIRR